VQKEERDMIYSKRVRAGKRTYFFDVRATKANDYFLTVTESRRQQRDGDFYFEKSKMFVYKEDFNKFIDALQETVNHIKTELLPEYDYEQFDRPDEANSNVATDVSNETTKIDLPSTSEPETDAFGGSELKWE
jgi:hypothetical protein